MRKMMGPAKGFLAIVALFAIFICSTPTAAQDLVAVRDITGGSSVFVFRTSAKAAPKGNFRSRPVRTKAQREATVRKVSRQYVALAKVQPRRTRSKVVEPDKLPPPPVIGRMPRDEASRLFAGVGEYYMDRDDFDHAIDFFREAVTLDPKYLSAQTGLSEALALKGNDLLVKDSNAAARKFFEEALTYNSKNSPAYYGLAEIYSALNDDEKARINYEKALENDKALTEIYVPLGILYFQQGEVAKADEYLTKAMQVDQNDPQTQYFLGLIRYSQNRNQEALTAFTNAKKDDPNYEEAFFQSGETLMRLGRADDAVKDYAAATNLKPTYFEAWLGLGAAQYQLGNYQDAVKADKKAVTLKNDSAAAYENLADAYRQLNDYNNAESNYNLAALFIERQKDFSKEQAADIYSKAAFMIAKQCEINTSMAVPCRWSLAVQHLEKAVAYSPSSVDLANLGWAYYNNARSQTLRGTATAAVAKSNLEKAKVNLQKASEGNSKMTAGPLVNLGMALTDLGDYAGAVNALKQAIDKEPDWTFAINELGIAYRKQNNFSEAAKQFRKAVDKDDKFAAALYNLGEAEFKNGNLGEAKKAYDKLRKLGRNDLANQLTLASGGKIRG